MLVWVDNVSKSFPGASGDVAVLKGVSFKLMGGETLALTGESGSGKSTLLHLIAALETPDAGDIVIQGVRLGALDDAARAALRRTALGVVFQQFNLIPSLDVERNISFQARLAGREDRDWQEHLIGKLGLGPERAKYPEQLSGGQQQRVAIGRALAARPSLILADEPTGNLDEATGDKVLDLMLELVSETGAALLMVTHSERLAARMGRRLHLSQGQLS